MLRRRCARWLLVGLLAMLWGCQEQAKGIYQGYVEGEFVYVAGKLAGRLDDLAVSRGRTVAPGDLLFALEHDYETRAVAQAEAEVRQAEATLRDKEKGLRPEEIAQIEADLGRARAARELSHLEYQRRVKLFADATIAKEELDTARTTRTRDLQQVRELEAKLATGKLASRVDQVRAAGAAVEAARAVLAQARWNLEEKTQRAGVGGLVFDVLHYVGEWVGAGSPVVTLLPPQNVKIRFFVPQAVAGGLAVGAPVRVSWDGGGAPVAAAISYIAPSVEYTPPVIYSQDFRDKLVIMVEARVPPAEGGRLHPGQPVDVALGAGADGGPK